MRSFMFAALGLFACSAVNAQEFKKEYIAPNEAEASSTAVKVKGGTLVFLAGFTASAPQRDAELGNFETQAKSAMGKISDALKQSGATLDDIVQLSVYVTDLRNVPKFTAYAKTLFKPGSYPAVTFVEVAHLARPESLMEIQPVAAIK